MCLSAERIAIANRAIEQTFAQASVAWQAVPHWDTGDPGQALVRSDRIFALKTAEVTALADAPPVPPLPLDPFGADPIKVDPHNVPFKITLAQATAPTPDALLASVVARTVELAQRFDNIVIPALATPATDAAAAAGAKAVPAWYRDLAAPAPSAPTILMELIFGRRLLEDSGYRAQACLIASTAHFIDLNQWVGSNVATEGLLVGANANSLHRATALDAQPKDAKPNRMLMIGRRQEIAHGSAATASSGEESVDLAISVRPSLEVIGENAAGQIDLAVRICFATRIKDERGIVVFHA